MPRQRGPSPTGQQLEPILETSGEFLDAEHRDARRCQLDREGHAVDPPADRRDQSRVAPVRREVGHRCTRPFDKQPNRAILQRIVLVVGILCRHGERRDRKDPFPLDLQGLAAGCENMDRRAGPQHGLGQRRGAVDDMLAGIQHQQQPPAGEHLRHPLYRNLTAAKLKPECSRNRGRNKGGIAERRELRQPHAVGKVRQQLACEREGNPCLADSAGAGQGDEPMRGGKVQGLTHLVVAADQLGKRLGQVRHRNNRCGLRRDSIWAGIAVGPRHRTNLADKLIPTPGDGAHQIAIRT